MAILSDSEFMINFRHKWKLTQIDAAKELGVSISTISRIECNKRNLSLKMRKKLNDYEDTQNKKLFLADSIDEMFERSINNYLRTLNPNNGCDIDSIRQSIYRMLHPNDLPIHSSERYLLFLERLLELSVRLCSEEIYCIKNNRVFAPSKRSKSIFQELNASDQIYLKMATNTKKE